MVLAAAAREAARVDALARRELAPLVLADAPQPPARHVARDAPVNQTLGCAPLADGPAAVRRRPQAYLEAALANVVGPDAPVRAVVVEENKPFCGVGAQIASTISTKVFDDLDAPVGRVSALDAPAIYSPPAEKMQIPTSDVVIAKVLELE